MKPEKETPLDATPFSAVIRETRNDMDVINANLAQIRRRRDLIKQHDASPTLLSDVDKLNADLAQSRIAVRMAVAASDDPNARKDSVCVSEQVASNSTGVQDASTGKTGPRSTSDAVARLNDRLTVELRDLPRRRTPQRWQHPSTLLNAIATMAPPGRRSVDSSPDASIHSSTASLIAPSQASALMEAIKSQGHRTAAPTAAAAERLNRVSSRGALATAEPAHHTNKPRGGSRPRTLQPSASKRHIVGTPAAGAASTRTARSPTALARYRGGTANAAAALAVKGASAQGSAKARGGAKPHRLARAPSTARASRRSAGSSGGSNSERRIPASVGVASGRIAVASRRGSAALSPVHGGGSIRALTGQRRGSLRMKAHTAASGHGQQCAETTRISALNQWPVDVDFDAVARNTLLQVHLVDARVAAEMPPVFTHTNSIAVIRMTFWYCFACLFQPGSESLRCSLLQSIASSYIEWSLVVRRQDDLLQAFPFLLAECVFQAFPCAFPGSMACYNEFFHDTLLLMVGQLFIGLDVHKGFFQHCRARVLVPDHFALGEIFSKARSAAVQAAAAGGTARRRTTIGSDASLSSIATLASSATATSSTTDMLGDDDLEDMLFDESVDQDKKKHGLPRRQRFHLYHTSPLLQAFMQRGDTMLRRTRMQRVLPGDRYMVAPAKVDGACMIRENEEAESRRRRQLQRANSTPGVGDPGGEERESRENIQRLIHTRYDSLRVQVKRDLSRLHRSLRHEKQRLRQREQRLRQQNETGLNDFIMDIIEQQSMVRTMKGRKLFNYVKVDAARGAGGNLMRTNKEESREQALYQAGRGKRQGPVMVWSTMELVHRS